MKLTHRWIILLTGGSSLLACCTGNNTPEQKAQSDKAMPNIVYILADDLGYGDLSCYYPEGKIKTPRIDKLASEGMRFTDAHSPSSVCTPTRYAILTGQYPWRSKLPQGVLRGYGRSLISQGDYTVPHMLQEQGYRTAVVGKWHLGLDWKILPGREEVLQPGSYGVRENGLVTDVDPANIDFGVPPTNGPLTRGFDYSYILPASLDMDPYCYLENDTLTEMPTAHTPGNDLTTGYTGAFWRPGKIAPSFEFDQVLGNFTEKATSYLTERASEERPFFLYLAFAGPHTPWVPTDDFKGKSRVGLYGDFVQMVDDAVGKVLDKLENLGLAENTIVIFTSDNGPFWRPASIERFNHRAAGPWRGMKADIYEGGHRIPFIVRWPGKVPSGTVTAAPTTLANLAATCADVLGIQPVASARDSYSILPVLMQNSDTVPGQAAIVHHSSKGHFAIRQGPWKLIDKLGSGGFSEPSVVEDSAQRGQLYDLRNDPAESRNLYDRSPRIVQRLQDLLSTIKNTP